MDFLELAKKRYSVRKFTDKKVSDAEIEKIIEAGLVAPTACNNQPFRIIAVKSEEGLEKFRKCTECHYGCTLGFVICYDEKLCWTSKITDRSSGDIDASIVTTHMMLEAADLGIGSTWVMYFIPEAVKEEFALEDGIIPTALLVMGYPDKDAKPSPMHTQYRDRKETVRYE